MKKQPASPNFDAHLDEPMEVRFLFPDGNVGTLVGKCRGFGPITGDEKPHETIIGIYTATGELYTIKVDLRVKCAISTFTIGGKKFQYPVVECGFMLVKVDPNTGKLDLQGRP